MKLYSAIDLHSNNHVLTIIDEQDQKIFEQRLEKNWRQRYVVSRLINYLIQGSPWNQPTIGIGWWMD